MTLLILSLAFIVGVLAGLRLGGAGTLSLGLAVAAASLGLLRPRWRPSFWLLRVSPWAVLVAAALGMARGQFARELPLSEAQLRALAEQGAYVRVRGRIVRPLGPQGDEMRFILEVSRVALAQEPSHAAELKGRVLARVPWLLAHDWRYGDEVTLVGRLWAPRTSTSYRAYLARYGAVAVLDAEEGGWIRRGSMLSPWAWIFALRDRAYALVRKYWPAPESGLFAGILLGLEGDISPQLYDAFRETGTAHIIVISGFNITVIAGLMTRGLGRWLGRRVGALVAILAIALYTLLVGADAAVVRAALMGGSALIAQQLGRRTHGYTTLAFTAALMAGVQPWVLFDIGFQLSFAATLGLLVFAEPLTQGAAAWLQRYLAPRWVRALLPGLSEFFLLTLAAQIMTIPLSVYYFRKVSLIGLLANPVVLPLQSPLMVLGGLALLVGLVWAPAGQVLAWLAWPWAALTIRAVEAFAQASVTTLTLPPPPWWAIALYYAFLLGGRALWPYLKPILQPVLQPGLLALALFTLDIGLWGRIANQPDGLLHLWFLPLPGEQVVLARGPQGGWVLVNGGRDALALDRALARWHAGPDFAWWIVASNRQDALQALPRALDRYTPQRVWWIPTAGRDPAYRALREALQAEEILVVHAQPGQRLRQGSWTVTLVQQTPRGGVLDVAFDRFRARMIWAFDPQALTPTGRATLYLVGHAALLTPDLIRAIADAEPRLVVLGPAPRAGYDRSNQLPKHYSGQVWRPATMGVLHLWTDGQRLGLATRRPFLPALFPSDR
ncbi:MAG: ComEC family competence protein [Chloroflexi bacterium]|nr:ComEC family competence protein [Chloroflexota bacterium]